jgi:hypothetical protein
MTRRSNWACAPLSDHSPIAWQSDDWNKDISLGVVAWGSCGRRGGRRRRRRRSHSRCRGRAWRTGATDLAERDTAERLGRSPNVSRVLFRNHPPRWRKQPPSQHDWLVAQGRHTSDRPPSALDSPNSRAPFVTKLISHRRVHANGSHIVVTNGSAVATRVLPRHHGLVVSKLEGKRGKDGWVPKIFFYRPRSVEGKTGKRMIFRREVMRGEAFFSLGATSPGAGAISRGRRRSAQKYLLHHLGTLANPFARWPLAACVPRGESI